MTSPVDPDQDVDDGGDEFVVPPTALGPDPTLTEKVVGSTDQTTAAVAAAQGIGVDDVPSDPVADVQAVVGDQGIVLPVPDDGDVTDPSA